MSLIILIPVSIGMGLIGLAAFTWALRHDQFDDLQGSAERVLIPDRQSRPRGGEDKHTAVGAEESDRQKAP